MNGIQFYLKHDVAVVRGHTVYMDSPWALTSISQAQFWPEVDLRARSKGAVAGILSVDVSDWETPGLGGKAAMDCSRDELVAQVDADRARFELDEARAELDELRTERVDDMILDLPSQTTHREQLRRQRESDAALIANLDRAVEEDEQPEDPTEARVRDMVDELRARTGK